MCAPQEAKGCTRWACGLGPGSLPDLRTASILLFTQRVYCWVAHSSHTAAGVVMSAARMLRDKFGVGQLAAVA
jgi:hypothetical protein